jgi:hypothetical protein
MSGAISGNDDSRQQPNNENEALFPTHPDRRPSRLSPAGGVIFLLSGIMGLGPSGKAMTGNVVAAPAPGSIKSTNSIAGRGDGVGCLPSLDKVHAPGEWVRRFFCDVHRRAKNGEGYRISFTTDGVGFGFWAGAAGYPSP